MRGSVEVFAEAEEFGPQNTLPSRMPETRSHVRAADAASEQDFCATLLAMAGHDLRQPLQLITTAHDLLAAMLQSDEQREELARAADATSRLATMLDQIVEALQLHELSWDGRREPVSLEPLLQELTREFVWAARSKGVSLRIVRSRAVVQSHPMLLRGILRNLLRNAIDYTPSGGRVVIACQVTGPELRIEVRDTGVGIGANALATIFGAFQRTDISRPDGLGLGLFIVRRAAQLLSHRMEVHSVEGAGSRFILIADGEGDGAADVPPGSYVEVTVSDTGAGMASALIARIFEPFFTTKDVGQGSGLGLSQVYGFIKQSDGHVTVDSAVGVGSRFRLYLPYSESLPRSVGGADARPMVRECGGERILIVEDNEEVRAVAVAIIKDLGYQVMMARDGNEALKLLRSDAAIDLLFTDIVMPNGMDGVALANAACALRSHIRVLLKSGYPARAGPVANTTAFPLIQKPYRQNDLARVLRNTLDG